MHADDVRTQIREKEQVRVAERNAFFEEGVKLDEEARQRRAKLEDVKKKKLEILRCVCSPWKYIYFFNQLIIFPLIFFYFPCYYLNNIFYVHLITFLQLSLNVMLLNHYFKDLLISPWCNNFIF